MKFGDATDEKESYNATVSAGKIIVPAVMEANSYANDPTSQFLNISSLGFGAWETAQEARGTSLGVSLQVNHASWSATVVAAMLPDVAGGNGFWLDVDQCHSITAQVAFDVAEGGRLRMLGFYNRANAVNFERAAGLLSVASQNGIAADEVDVTEAQYLQTKLGFGIECEQRISDGIGSFFRASWNDGNSESYTFTQINSSLNLGADFSGMLWGEEDHHAGLSLVYNMLSEGQKKFIEAGGSGFMIGNGTLNYRPEIVTEGYYRIGLMDAIGVTFNYQFIMNPGYDADTDALHLMGTRLTVNL
ncbi:MAG: carbohydrate porin [Candidatus Kapabacteria bacterium]|nr:carbohydrate porin [Candidatus Kapabacteria bacterium]